MHVNSDVRLPRVLSGVINTKSKRGEPFEFDKHFLFADFRGLTRTNRVSVFS